MGNHHSQICKSSAPNLGGKVALVVQEVFFQKSTQSRYSEMSLPVVSKYGPEKTWHLDTVHAVCV